MLLRAHINPGGTHILPYDGAVAFADGAAEVSDECATALENHLGYTVCYEIEPVRAPTGTPTVKAVGKAADAPGDVPPVVPGAAGGAPSDPDKGS